MPTFTQNNTSDAPPVPIVVEDRTTETRKRLMVSHDNSKMAADAMLALAERGGIYQRGGQMVVVVPVAETEIRDGRTCEVVRHRIVPVCEARLRLLLTEAITFVKPADKPTLPPEPCGIPRTLPSDLLVSPLPFPVLDAVVESPTIRPDGTLITKPGYDPISKVYLATDLKVNIPEYPTREDALAAKDKLLGVISDYRWAEGSPGDSVWLSGVLSMAARPAIGGPVPLHNISATVRGSGKTRAVEAACIIPTGNTPAMQPYPRRAEEEVTKILLTYAIEGWPVICWDNVVGPFGCASLDSALTTGQMGGRVLGSSKTAGSGRGVPLHAVQWATGNQMEPTGDMSRRMVIATIDPKHERPEERDGPEPGKPWDHDDLIGYVRSARAELLGAALTIVRAYIVAGCPPQPMRRMDFIAWSRLIRGAIIWLGLRDPAETAAAARAADRTLELHRAIVEAWPYCDGHYPQTSDLIEAARQYSRSEWGEVLGEHWPEGSKSYDNRHHLLGTLLRQIKGSVISGYQIVQPPVKKGEKPLKIPRWARVPLGVDPPQYLSAPQLRPEVKSPSSSTPATQGFQPAAAAQATQPSTTTGAFTDLAAAGGNIGVFSQVPLILTKHDGAPPSDRPAQSLLDRIASADTNK